MARSKIVRLADHAAAPEAQAVEAVPAIFVPLADLTLSPLNPRQDHDPDSIAALAESLRIAGLIQTLGGYRDPEGRVAIVAGGRRLAALRLAAETRPDLDPVPVRLAPDEATARLWALAENTAREPLHIADEVRAYRRMAEGGSPLPVIASAFAVTEAYVRRRLKLASLPDPVLDALKAGQISAGHAAALTLASDPSRQIAGLAEVTTRRISEDSLRRLLTQEHVRKDDRRACFVGLPAYEAAGGTVTRDLFAAEGDAYLDDPALLDRLFAEALEATAATLRAEGWRWIETHPDAYLPWGAASRMTRLYPEADSLPEDDDAELHALGLAADAGELDDAGFERMEALEARQTSSHQPAQKAVAGGWLYVDHDGGLCADLGFVRPQDAEEAVTAGVMKAPRAAAAAGAREAEAPAKGPYSAALTDDLQAIRLAAVQTALLDKPDLMLDLLAFSLDPATGHPGRILAVHPQAQRIDPAEAEGFTRDPRLRSGPSYGSREDDPVAAFAAFRAKGPAHRAATITEALARALVFHGTPRDPASALFAQIETESGAAVRAVWRPTARNFFGRITAGALDDLLRDLLGLDATAPAFKAFHGMKKAAKADALERLFTDPETQAAWSVTPEIKARLDAWTPPTA